ncbi:MAG: class I tRNA ligase family protein [Candidatus Gottesmanbacteria bacterium]|nr:class I tRNA ligase family protein [Candidatus Gottesmanbacteria bacterium]
MTDSPIAYDKYDGKAIEEKWRKAWEEVALDSPDLASAKRPYYNLMMFPYPSAEGLHVGNMYAFTGSDIYGRFKRMQGYDVFEPIGLDGFGIHSENFALKIGRHPMDHAVITQKNYYNQLHAIGAMFDWTRTVETYNPDYYRWTQWVFTQMFKHGLCYRGKAEVNWCPSCKTVLADEQVIDNSCERCGKMVEKRQLEQWFFKITAYAEKLLQNSFSLDWATKVKVAQKAWIGKKEGIHITYPVVTKDGAKVADLTCFTTRPDTNFGATFVVMAPEHPLVGELFTVKSQTLQVNSVSNDGERALSQINAATTAQILDYVQASKQKTPQDRVAEGRKKTGVFTGYYCVNGLNGKKLPLYISDFVLAGFGTGAVIGVPGHDKRDFAFAIQFDIDIQRVVIAPDGDTSPISRPEQVQEEEGVMVNSGFLNGIPVQEAIEKMKDYLVNKGWGKRVTTYHLRDWLISRQRYWGPPIPMIYCQACAKADKGEQKAMPGWFTVPDSELPVVLPRIDDYKPGDDGVAPLAKHKEFYETTCPGCGGKAVRETDVSDTFLDSSWYFLRYPSVARNLEGGRWKMDIDSGRLDALNFQDVKESKVQDPSSKISNFKKSHSFPWNPDITKKWLPVHMYTGGAEHSVLHLMYSRFVTMALHDWGYIDFDEPFSSFYAHGLVIKDGAKMSKSKGNVVNPDDYIKLYGADALRLYLMFTGPYDQGGDFRDSAMEGMARWVQKVWRLAMKNISSYDASDPLVPSDSSQHSILSSATVKKALHRAIKKVGEDLERRRYNTAIATMMEFVNIVVDEEGARPQTPEPRPTSQDEVVAGGRSDGGRGVMGSDDLGNFLKILAPFAPYMTEELYQRLRAGMTDDQLASPTGGLPLTNEKKGSKSETLSQYTFTKSNSIHFQPWPAYDPKLLVDDSAEIAVQVNGKLRATVVVSRQSSVVREEVEKSARQSDRVAKHLEGKTVIKVIFVPGKLINFVV